jgi:hypothetical protein
VRKAFELYATGNYAIHEVRTRMNTVARLTLEPLRFLNLTLRLGFGARRKIFAKASTVEAGVELENDIPRGIREFRNDEWTCVFHDRFGRSTAKSDVGAS